MVKLIQSIKCKAIHAFAVLRLAIIIPMKNTKKTTFEQAEQKLIAVVIASVEKRQVAEKGKRAKVAKFAIECLPLDGTQAFTVWLEANQQAPALMSKQIVLSKFVPSKYKAPRYSIVNA